MTAEHTSESNEGIPPAYTEHIGRSFTAWRRSLTQGGVNDLRAVIEARATSTSTPVGEPC